jgi:hypothetical protein
LKASSAGHRARTSAALGGARLRATERKCWPSLHVWSLRRSRFGGLLKTCLKFQMFTFLVIASSGSTCSPGTAEIGNVSVSQAHRAFTAKCPHLSTSKSDQWQSSCEQAGHGEIIGSKRPGHAHGCFDSHGKACLAAPGRAPNDSTPCFPPLDLPGCVPAPGCVAKRNASLTLWTRYQPLPRTLPKTLHPLQAPLPFKPLRQPLK